MKFSYTHGQITYTIDAVNEASAIAFFKTMKQTRVDSAKPVVATDITKEVETDG